MQLQQLIETVHRWALSEPLVRKAYLFGSRVKGTAHDESDLDIAIEVEKLRGDSGEYTSFVFESEKLCARLQKELPFPVDLQWYGGLRETPIIHAALAEASVLAFERDALSSQSRQR